jgi:transcriptional regulator with XRE-family HTH domain
VSIGRRNRYGEAVPSIAKRSSAVKEQWDPSESAPTGSALTGPAPFSASPAEPPAAENLAELALRLRETLARRKMSQTELARRLAGPGAPARVVESKRRLALKWIAARHAPTPETAKELARILGVADTFFVVDRTDGKREMAQIAEALETLDALEFARASKLADPDVQGKPFKLPMKRPQIQAFAPTFNPDWILLDTVSALVPGVKGEAEIEFHPDTIRGLSYWWAGSGLVPGQIQVEACAQLAALLLLALPGNGDRAVLNAGIDKTRFRHPVKAGGRLSLSCEVSNMRGDVANVKARGYLDDVLAIRTELIVVAY